MCVAQHIELTDSERVQLTKWSRGRSTQSRLVLRSKIVLMAADGYENKDIASQLMCTRRTVSRWRNRFAQLRLSGVKKMLIEQVAKPRYEKQKKPKLSARPHSKRLYIRRSDPPERCPRPSV